MSYREDIETTLQDTLHNCLMCDGPAYEYEKDTYRCADSECGCSWKVEACDD